jgi:hypothetical protein
MAADRFLYKSRYRYLAMVPAPYATTNKTVHTDVTMNPMGKIPKVVPGKTNTLAVVIAAAAVKGFETVAAMVDKFVN